MRDIHYQGIYVLTEKIKIAKDRVNIDRVGAEDLKPPKVTGGYLLKFDRVGPGESGVFGAETAGWCMPNRRSRPSPCRNALRKENTCRNS